MIKAVACLQLAAVIIEFLLPWILKRFYLGYDSRKMAMSILGSPSSPVSSLSRQPYPCVGSYLNSYDLFQI